MNTNLSLDISVKKAWSAAFVLCPKATRIEELFWIIDPVGDRWFHFVHCC